MCKEIKNFSDLPKIIAVDFDGTLVEDKWPEIGRPNKNMFEFLKYLQKEHNVKLILWTSRTDSHLIDAVEFCNEQGMRFDAINENIPEVRDFTGRDTRKVYADLYIDDRAVHETQSPVYWCNKIGLSWYELMGHIPAY